MSPSWQLSSSLPSLCSCQDCRFTQGTPKKALASAPDAGLGSQAFHKLPEAMLPPYLPGQSAATAEVKSLRAFDPSQDKNMHVNPTSTDTLSHRGWYLVFLSYLTCAVFSSERQSHRTFVNQWTWVCFRAPRSACTPQQLQPDPM